MFNPQPKSLPKLKKTFGYDYWTKVRKKSAEKKKMKLKPITERDEKFYAYLWKTRKHECENCGNKLNEPKKHNFHHKIPKSLAPYFRHDERNMAVLCWGCHQKAESSISYPKMVVFERYEKEKTKLYAELGIEYVRK